MTKPSHTTYDVKPKLCRDCEEGEGAWCEVNCKDIMAAYNAGLEAAAKVAESAANHWHKVSEQDEVRSLYEARHQGMAQAGWDIATDIRALKDCTHCEGDGHDPAEFRHQYFPCPSCGGTGKDPATPGEPPTGGKP
jgi:hypothetical protein